MKGSVKGASRPSGVRAESIGMRAFRSGCKAGKNVIVVRPRGEQMFFLMKSSSVVLATRSITRPAQSMPLP